MAATSSRIRVTRRRNTSKPVRKYKLVEISGKNRKACMLCKSTKIDETLYGKLYQLNDVVLHHFCILLSSQSVQNGQDNEGILGFLLNDINNEIKRGNKLKCFYCGDNGASIACCKTKCNIVFHLPCGLKNGSMHQYFQNYDSFCSNHRIKQTIDRIDLKNTSAVKCGICMCDVKRSNQLSTIWAPCCKRNAWFHRLCIQKLALSAGYFFKCPLCNNSDSFKNAMLTYGIYIPARDAVWETEPGAFAELLERYNKCDVTNCLCSHKEKRNFHEESGQWEIILCGYCGSSGAHRLCSSLDGDQETWSCATCTDVGDTVNKSRNTRLGLPSLRSCSGTSVMHSQPSSTSQSNDSTLNLLISDESHDSHDSDDNREQMMSEECTSRNIFGNLCNIQ